MSRKLLPFVIAPNKTIWAKDRATAVTIYRTLQARGVV